MENIRSVTLMKSLSDSELENGLPSSDSSDEEQSRKSCPTEIYAAKFCNRLREETKPLLNLSQGIQSPTKQLKDIGIDKSRESKAKKRLARGRQEAPNGVIERRYGYIPNPRWPKPATAYSRPYEPQGINQEDSLRIPGAIFRSKVQSKSNSSLQMDHSYQEIDFPELSLSNVNRLSLKPDEHTSNNSSEREDASDISSNADSRHSFHKADDKQRISSSLYGGISPITSTPVKRGESTVYGKSIVMTSESGLGPCSSKKETFFERTSSSNDSKDQSNWSYQEHVKPFGGKSKPLSPSPLANLTCSSSDSSHEMNFQNSNVDTSLCEKIFPNSFLQPDLNQNCSTMSSTCASWSRIVQDHSPLQITERIAPHGLTPPSALGGSQNNNKAGAWANKLDPKALKSESKVHNSAAPETKQKSNLNNLEIKIHSNSNSGCHSSWSDIARASPSGQQSRSQYTSVPHFTRTSYSDKSESFIHNIPPADAEKKSELGIDRSQNMESKRRNKKSKDGSNKFVGDGLLKKQQVSNGRANPKNGDNGTYTLPFESFITPKKVIGKKNVSVNGRKDLGLLESRFVEQMEAKATSPPKKVKPSPIKRLNFSKSEEEKNLLRTPVRDSALALPLETSFSGISVDQPNTSPNDSKPSTLNSVKLSGKLDPVLSLEKLINDKRSHHQKDEFEDENEDEDEYPGNNAVNTSVEQFWKEKSVTKKSHSACVEGAAVNASAVISSEEDDEDFTCLTAHSENKKFYEEGINEVIESRLEIADPSKVTCKISLKKYARRYCHFIEEHQVPNVIGEMYFLIQLLTCSEIDRGLLQFVDDHCGGTYFRSVHNGVYFAVTVIKRLKSLFLALDRTFLELLATCQKIELFSPKLHKFFLKAVESRNKDPVLSSNMEYNTFNPENDGAQSFPDANHFHVFKCQRDNFFAFYRHYHDTNNIYEFKIENQIQYVYDGCTPEQNSMVNLVHLAQLFLDHMILCCVHQSGEKVDLFKLIQSKDQDEKLFKTLYETFCQMHCVKSVITPPGFSENQMFFKDFLETLSSPSFNEHLRNLVVQKILQLNSTKLNNVRNLHSVITVEENQTPLRSHKLTEVVMTLCVLGKLLGYLTFSSYNTGSLNIPQELAELTLKLREAVPLPLPLPRLLRDAFTNGHLCLTVPWIVEYLAMMDSMAPQLVVYQSLLRKLHFIQRYAWTKLYKEGHHNTGLLVVSCISALFEAPSVPSGFFFSCDSSKEDLNTVPRCDMTFKIDYQKVVSHRLLTSCCPYIERGQVLLTMFLINHNPVLRHRPVLPLTTKEDANVQHKSTTDWIEIEDWLNSSLALDSVHFSEGIKQRTNVIDDEVVPAYVLTRLVAHKDRDDLDDLESNLIQSSPCLQSTVDMSVEVLTAKIVDYTHHTILRLLVFEAKVEIRAQFLGMGQGHCADSLKDKIFSQANLIAQRYTDKAKTSFYEVVDKCCSKELPELIHFLTSGKEEDIHKSIIHLCKKLIIRHMEEWRKVQLYPEFFHRIVVREAEKCSRGRAKHLSLYPSDYSRKLEELPSVHLAAGFTEMDQLSELIDKALSHGVWYINALTPGNRPDDSHMVQLIQDFTKCVEKRMITMDFAFYVMSNFLMHLIIQYIVDAPQNWTDEAAQAFIRLCKLCKDKKHENDRLAIKLSEFVRKKKRMKIKVLNLMSVHSVQWLTKSETQNETLMAFCKLISLLVESDLLHVETVYRKLVHSRENKNLDMSAKMMVNKILVKVLELLWENSISPERQSYSLPRLLALVEDMASILKTAVKTDQHKVLLDLEKLLKSTFGSVVNLDNFNQ